MFLMVPFPMVASSTIKGYSANGSTNSNLKSMLARVKNGIGRGKIVIKGDSTTVGDGGGNTSRADGARQNRWTSAFASKLSNAGYNCLDLGIVGTNNIQSGGTSFSSYDPRVNLGSGTPWVVNGTGATNASISQQFAGGSWLTSGAVAQSTTSNANPLTMTSATYDSSSPKFGAACLSGGYGRLSGNPLTSYTAFTIDAWVKGTASALQVAAQISGEVWIGQDGSGNAMAGLTSNNHITSSTKVNDGNWHHLMMCGDANSTRLYCDGSLVGSGAALTSFNTGNGGDSPVLAFRIYVAATSYSWTGSVDEGAAWNKVLATGSTYAVPTAPRSGTETGLAALYHFDGNGADATGGSTLNNCLSLTENCDRFEVVIYDTTSGNQVGFWLDGNSITPVGNSSVTTANSGGFKTFTIAASSIGTHTLSIGATVGTIDLRSIRPYSSAVSAADIVVHASCAAASGDQAYTNGQNRNQESLAFDAPDLTIIMLGFNDANQGVSTSTFQTNLGAIIDKAKSLGDILIIGTYMAQGNFESPAMRSAASSVASAKNVAFMDLNSYYGGVVPPNMYDQVHRTAAGYADMGAIIEQAVIAMVS